jgi:hypothetical protein
MKMSEPTFIDENSSRHDLRGIMLPDEFEKLLDSCFIWEGQMVQTGGVIQAFLY